MKKKKSKSKKRRVKRAEYKFILVGERPVPEPNLMKWAKWIENTKNRIIRGENVGRRFWVSTVFLGYDSNFSLRSKRPVLFETMVFSRRMSYHTYKGRKFPYCKSFDDYSQRYHTWKEAIRGHNKTVKLLKLKELR